MAVVTHSPSNAAQTNALGTTSAALSGSEIEGLAAEVTSAQAEVTSATANVTQATAEVAQAQATLAQCMSTLADAQNILAMVQALLAEHLASQPPEHIWEEDSNGNLCKAPNPEYATWLTRKNDLEGKVRDAESAVHAAEAAVDSAEQNLQSAQQRLEDAKQALKQAKTKVEQTKQRLEQAKADLEKRQMELMQGLDTDDFHSPELQQAALAEQELLGAILTWEPDIEIEAANAAIAKAEELEIVENWAKLTPEELDKVTTNNLATYNEIAAANGQDALEVIPQGEFFKASGAGLGLNEEQTAWLAAINDETWAASDSHGAVMEQLAEAAAIIPPGVWAQLQDVSAEQQQAILQNFSGTALAAAATETTDDDFIPWDQITLAAEGLAIQTEMPLTFGQGFDVWSEFHNNPDVNAAQFFDLQAMFGAGYPTQHYNLCGELSIAAAMGIPPEELLAAFNELHPSILADKTMGTSIANLQPALETFGWQGAPINLAADPYTWYSATGSYTPQADTVRDLLAPEDSSMLALVRLNGTTGEVDPSGSINHWVLVEEVVTLADGRDAVIVYNPYQNEEKVYSFDNFVKSWTPSEGNYRGMVVAPGDVELAPPTNPNYTPPQ